MDRVGVIPVRRGDPLVSGIKPVLGHFDLVELELALAFGGNHPDGEADGNEHQSKREIMPPLRFSREAARGHECSGDSGRERGDEFGRAYYVSRVVFFLVEPIHSLAMNRRTFIHRTSPIVAW
ncbi:hypothetical protein [Mycobacterium sp. URHB0021]